MVITNNSEKTHNKLSIQVSLNGLSFCILNQEEDRIIFFKKRLFQKQLDPVKVLAEIQKEYEKEESLNQNIEEVNLIFSNPLFTLVPEDLFDEENASNYLKFNTKILKTDFIAFDKINPDLVNIYVPYANITNYFFDKYGEFEYRHGLSVLIGALLKQPKSEKHCVYLHVHNSSYEMVVIKNGKLLLANSFEYDTREDFLYYILFTAEQLNMDPLELELILLGDISKETEEYEMAWNYIKNISFLGHFHSYAFAEAFKPENELAEYLLLKSL